MEFYFYSASHPNLSNYNSLGDRRVSKAHSTYILVEMKQGECIGPLSWSVHCNFVSDGNYSEKLVVGVHPPTLTSLG
jgi:hypothetical protein